MRPNLVLALVLLTGACLQPGTGTKSVAPEPGAAAARPDPVPAVGEALKRVDSLLASGLTLRSIDLLYGPECDGRLLDREHFVVCHQDDWHEPRWVAYNLTADETVDRVPRRSRFRVDPDLSPDEAAEPADYARSGWAQGHLAPVDDFRYSADAERATFVLSNSVPQSPAVNSGRWAAIEREVGRLAERHGNLWIVSGPLFLDRSGRPAQPARFIGASRVAVPTHVFKAVLCLHADGAVEMFAFLVPNGLQRIPGPSGRYLVSVDEIEALAGLDLFTTLDAATQRRLEAQPAAGWPVP